MGAGASTKRRSDNAATGPVNDYPITAKERWNEVRVVAKTVAYILNSDDDDVYRVFKTYSTKKNVKHLPSSHLVIESDKLDMALSSLGVTKGTDQACLISPTSPSLDFAGFKGLAENAIRNSLISSIVKGSELHSALSLVFPVKVEDVLELTEASILDILKHETFVASAARSIFASIQNHSKSKHIPSSIDSETDSGPETNPSKDPGPARYVSPESALATMEKYHSNGGFVGNFGDKRMFDSGLEAEIGLADPFILKAILREHLQAEDSERHFLTANYGLETTPAIEFARLLGTDDAVSFLRQAARRVSAGAASAASGPSALELEELTRDLDRLARIHRLVEATGHGKYPGEEGDECGEALVHATVAMRSNGAAEAALEPLTERLAAALGAQDVSPLHQSARRVDIAVPPFAEQESVGVTFAVPLPPAPAGGAPRTGQSLPAGTEERLRDLLARAAGVDPGQVRAELVAERTFVYCEFADEAELRRSLALRTDEELRALAAAARAAAPPSRKPMHPRHGKRQSGGERPDPTGPAACVEAIVKGWRRETEEWRRKGRFRRQARRRLTLRELMAVPQVRSRRCGDAGEVGPRDLWNAIRAQCIAPNWERIGGRHCQQSVLNINNYNLTSYQESGWYYLRISDVLV